MFVREFYHLNNWNNDVVKNLEDLENKEPPISRKLQCLPYLACCLPNGRKLVTSPILYSSMMLCQGLEFKLTWPES